MNRVLTGADAIEEVSVQSGNFGVLQHEGRGDKEKPGGNGAALIAALGVNPDQAITRFGSWPPENGKPLRG